MAIASQLQLRRGTTPQHAVFTGAPGEVTVDTDKKTVVVHDGTTQGGFPLSRESVIATGSTTPRFIADRFTDQFVNVKDYGAVGDGVADDWLAIQRTILAASTDAEFYPNIATMTEADTTAPFANWPQVPILRSRKGRKWVYFPKGTYRITQSIGTYENTKICGDGAYSVRIRKAGTGAFPAFEDLHHWVARTFPDWPNWSQSNPIWLATPWCHGARFQGFRIEQETVWNGTDAAPTSWFRFPIWGDASENGNPCQATAGGNTVTTTLTGLALQTGDKIKFRGLPTEYTVASYNGTTITTVESIVTAPNGAHLQKKMPIAHGIVTAGGEQLTITDVLIQLQNGYGIYSYYGSPGIISEGGMINGCRVAYKIEANGTLIRPSGDNNGIFVENGIEQVSTIDIIAPKVEGGRTLSVGGGASIAPCVFRHGNIAPVSARMNIYGGTVNPIIADNAYYSSHAISNDTSLIEVWNKNFSWPSVNMQGPMSLGWGKNFYKEISYYAPSTILRRLPRTDDTIQYENGFHVSASGGAFFEAQNESKFVENTYNIILGSKNYVKGGGILMDPSTGDSTQTLSGGVGNITFTRSGTTATITTASAHNLQVGDYIALRNYASTTPSNTGLAGTNDGGETMYFTNLFRVMSVPSGTTFTITVTNTGATAGTASLYIYRYFVFHDVKQGKHRFQMPDELGDALLDRSAFEILDKPKRKLAGLRVGAPAFAEWWSRTQFTLGNTMNDPLLRIRHTSDTKTLSGATDVSAIIPAGSIVLGVTVRVTEAITGATTFDIGDGTDVDRWGAAIPVALGTTTTAANFTIASPTTYPAQTNVVLTANGGNFTGGKVKIVAHVITLNAPT